MGSNHNTLKEGLIKTHFYPQLRSTSTWKYHESEKNSEYGAVEVKPYSLWEKGMQVKSLTILFLWCQQVVFLQNKP